MRLPLKRRALPADDTAELWLTDVSRLPLDAGPAGLTRKQRILRRRIQQQFLLRLLLGAYLDCPGKSVRLKRNQRGKPALEEPQAACGLHFNLSHAGPWLAVAIGSGIGVGVDIESERRLPRARELARRFFPPEEAEWLAGQDEPFLSRHFLDQWTAREALVKARGTGLAGTLGRIRLAGAPPAIQALPDGWPAPEQWTLAAPRLPDGLIGHLAAARPDVSVRLIVLQPPDPGGE